MTIHDVAAKYRRRWKHIAECRQAVDDFAAQVNDARKRLKLTYEKLSLDTDISISRVRNLCLGDALPYSDELETLLSVVDLKGD